MTALLERERELAELDAMVAAALAGEGRLVAIEAHAGLGKTRLLQAAREVGSRAGLRCLTGRATELERDFPFALVRQLFHPRLAPSDRDSLLEGAVAARAALGLGDDNGDHGTFAVLHDLYWLTAALAEREPLLLAVDDAHWADVGSLDYLRFLLPRLAELPVLVVVACRPDDPHAADALAQLVTDAEAHRLSPAALSLEATTTLLAAELDRAPEPTFAAACHEVSGGNPFLLRELVRTLAAEGVSPSAEQVRRVRDMAPERITRMVLLRVGRLSPKAHALAHAIVVLGDDSDPRLVTELAGIDLDTALDAADELRRAAILDPGQELRFLHPLIRNAIDSDLPAGERAAAHARAATLLAAAGADVTRLATHLIATEPNGRRATVEALVEAGIRAIANGAPESATAYLKRALREPPPADLRAAVLEPLIMAAVRSADMSVYDVIESDIVDELQRNPSLHARWALRLTGLMLGRGLFDQALAMLKRAIEVAIEEGDTDAAFRLQVQFNTLTQCTPAEERERLKPYRDQIEPGSENDRVLAAADALWVATTGSAAEAVPLARRALAGVARVFDENPTLPAGHAAVFVLIGADEFEDAKRAADGALAIARRRNGLPDLAAAWALQGTVAWARGDMITAEVDAHQALDTARLAGLGIALPLMGSLLIDVLQERGDALGAAAELEASGMDSAPIPDFAVFALLLLARGRLRLAQGRADEAAEDLVELHKRMERWGLGSTRVLPVGAQAALAVAATGDLERARELAEAELTDARRWGAPTAIARARRALGIATGDLSQLEQAVAVLDGSPARLERAYALNELGAALRRANRRADAREPLREALDLARRCGAGKLAKLAYDELHACGERVRRYTPIGVESLTPSERRVAEMAASGMTNRQIGQSLFLTVKTIETHLSAAYDKLGIRSRQGLAEALRS